MIDIILVEDSALVRQSLCLALSTAGDMRIVAEVADGEAALEVISSRPAQILLLDLSLPGISGRELIQKVHQQIPELPILMLSMEANPDVVSQLITAGAAGYVSKGSKLDVLIEGIRNVAGGGFFVDPSIEPHLT